MEHYICATCGTQYPASEQPPGGSPPGHCPICEDERQYVGPGGQKWTTLDELRAAYHNVVKTVEPHLTGIGTHPDFAIGQRALLVQTPSGNLLWDCITLLDEATCAVVNALGGISAIAISHPHYYSSMVEWAHAFNAPVYLHAADRQWVMRPDPAIRFWDGETQALLPNGPRPALTLIRCGGHFDGGTVLHWATGAEGRGALLASDIINVVADQRWVSFLYSYPNQIPLPEPAIRRIWAAVEPFQFDRIYSAWWPRTVASGGRAAVRRSADRYIRAIGGSGL